MAQKKSAADSMRLLQEDIRTKSFRPCYLLYGTESYLIRQYRQNLTAAIVPGEDPMNLSVFTGSGIEEQQIIDLANTMPFFQDYRLIVLEDSGLFKNSSEKISAFLSHIPDTTILLFTEYPVIDPKYPDKKATKSVDKRNKTYKALIKYGFAAELNTPSDADLSRWVAGRLKREHKQITQSALRLFLSRSSSDMNQISNDLEKLLSYTAGQDSITDDDVDAICERRPEDHIFQMIDAISSKDRRTAFRLYADLVQLRTPPGRILYLISSQYENLLRVRELEKGGMSLAQIESETGMRHFAAEKCSRISRRYTTDELKRCLEQCAQAEEDFKTGKISDQMSLELLIAELSAP